MSKENNSNQYIYCNSLTSYSRLATRVVDVGGIPMGGANPIRIQSMTNTSTLDTNATVSQIIRLYEAGCEYVRITTPTVKEADNLKIIKQTLIKWNCPVPLIADVHFNPTVAETAALFADKVRINPGNYADKKLFRHIDYTESEYGQELDKIRTQFTPLVKLCKEHGKAMRIGTNHGSLSDRIVSRYGNTPAGMVESAMEFVYICEDLNYHDIVLSMKASNIRMMITAYRLLINRMLTEGKNYPVHLGVTEAGAGEDGIIKSAAGIGTLLEDGIGDTIRVSLAGPPEFEIPVAKAMVKRYNKRKSHSDIKEIFSTPVNPFEYSKRKTIQVKNIGGSTVPVIISKVINHVNEKKYPPSDYIYTGSQSLTPPLHSYMIQDSSVWNNSHDAYPIFEAETYFTSDKKSDELNFITVTAETLTNELISNIKKDNTLVLVFETDTIQGIAVQRNMFFKLIINSCLTPVIIKRTYRGINGENLRIYSSADFAGLLTDGLGDGIWLDADTPDVVSELAFDILQATGTRITKTEYIICPTCGRTAYNIQDVAAAIQQKTSHLKGLKIAIMGCIVNGPGEMADADYGCVGSSKGQLTLYKGKNIIRKDIPEELAAESLIELIKENGDWKEI